MTAAVLAAGPGAALSHRSAAAWWEIRRTDRSQIEVTVPRRGIRPISGVRIYASRRRDPVEFITHDGLPVTTVARTLVDLAAVLQPDALAKAVDEADAQRLLDTTALSSAVDNADGATGIGALRVMLGDRRAPPPTRSELEDRFLALCAQAGTPRPAVNARVAGLEVDFLWSEHRLIAETDGRRHHAARTAFERDRRRDALLLVAGYRVVRFTWRQVVRDPAHVVATLRALLA